MISYTSQQLTLQDVQRGDSWIGVVYRFTLDAPYDPNYTNSSSPQFTAFTSKIYQNILNSFNNLQKSLRFVNIIINNLTQGSVIVDSNLYTALSLSSTFNISDIISQVTSVTINANGSNVIISSMLLVYQNFVEATMSFPYVFTKPPEAQPGETQVYLNLFFVMDAPYNSNNTNTSSPQFKAFTSKIYEKMLYGFNNPQKSLRFVDMIFFTLTQFNGILYAVLLTASSSNLNIRDIISQTTSVTLNAYGSNFNITWVFIDYKNVVEATTPTLTKTTSLPTTETTTSLETTKSTTPTKTSTPLSITTFPVITTIIISKPSPTTVSATTSQSTMTQTRSTIQVPITTTTTYASKPTLSNETTTDTSTARTPTTSSMETSTANIEAPTTPMEIPTTKLTPKTTQAPTTTVLSTITSEQPLPAQHGETQITVDFRFVLDALYDSNYANPSSSQFKQFTSQISQNMFNGFKNLQKSLRFVNMIFYSLTQGSVVVNSSLITASSSNLTNSDITSQVTSATINVYGSNVSIRSMTVTDQSVIEATKISVPNDVTRIITASLPTSESTTLPTTSSKPTSESTTLPTTSSKPTSESTTLTTTTLKPTSESTTFTTTTAPTSLSTTTIPVITTTTSKPAPVKTIQVPVQTKFISKTLTPNEKIQSSSEYKRLVLNYEANLTYAFQSAGFKNVKIIILNITEGSIIVNYILVSIPPANSDSNSLNVMIEKAIIAKYPNTTTEIYIITFLIPPNFTWYIEVGVICGIILILMVLYVIIQQIKLYKKAKNKLIISLGQDFTSNIHQKRPSILIKHKSTENKYNIPTTEEIYEGNKEEDNENEISESSGSNEIHITEELIMKFNDQKEENKEEDNENEISEAVEDVVATNFQFQKS